MHQKMLGTTDLEGSLTSHGFCSTAVRLKTGADPGRRAIGAIASPKTYESNFIHHDFAQFKKQHSRYKAILPSVVLSQQCCEV